MLKLYNTLSKTIEEFIPLNPPKVGMYACGPTVYDFPQIGNWRTFVFDDLVRRALEYNDFQVTMVMNATDVGHLSGDNLGDADTGEDRLEKGAKRENKTVWEVAQEYVDDFVKTRSWLNILPPTHFTRATDHIKEQIELVQKLIDKGLAYETDTGVFFDVGKYPEYGKLSGQKLIDKRTAAREEVEKDETKRNPADFALWFKRVGKFADHQMHWPSPWGEGFPGWHIECSAMSMRYLGESFDIHTGGVDHIAIHHANEIAQSEGATGKLFSKYWLHGEFLTVDGGRMGKSLGNAYTLHDVMAKGFDPLVLRYFYLSAHYRTKLNFTWEALENAQKAYEKLKIKAQSFKTLEQNNKVNETYKKNFLEAVNQDLNMPEAVAVLWKLLDDSNVKPEEKYATLLDFDKVLGLGLDKTPEEVNIPEEVKKLGEEREKLRTEKKYDEADKTRQKIEALGFEIKDTPEGLKFIKKG